MCTNSILKVLMNSQTNKSGLHFPAKISAKGLNLTEAAGI